MGKGKGRAKKKIIASRRQERKGKEKAKRNGPNTRQKKPEREKNRTKHIRHREEQGAPPSACTHHTRAEGTSTAMCILGAHDDAADAGAGARVRWYYSADAGTAADAAAPHTHSHSAGADEQQEEQSTHVLVRKH